jgi:hypothetical protein
MDRSSYTYNKPLTKKQIEYHNKFKGAYGNLTNGLSKKMKAQVKSILKGLESCCCPVESITLVKKYVDARVKGVNNRDELIRDAWKEIYSLATNHFYNPPRVFGEHGPDRYY